MYVFHRTYPHMDRHREGMVVKLNFGFTPQCHLCQLWSLKIKIQEETSQSGASKA